MFTKKQQIILFVILIIFAIAVIAFTFYAQKNPFILSFKKIDNGNLDCVVEKEINTVRGNSLSGFIENEEEIIILEDYYNCNEIARDDIVAYEYSANPALIIKIIKALPGDTFALVSTGANYNLKINNKLLKTSGNNLYSLSEQKSKMLRLYEKNYQGVVPVNTYLLLGNQVSGTLDSTIFGLINKQGIVGKVVKF